MLIRVGIVVLIVIIAAIIGLTEFMYEFALAYIVYVCCSCLLSCVYVTFVCGLVDGLGSGDE